MKWFNGLLFLAILLLCACSDFPLFGGTSEDENTVVASQNPESPSEFSSFEENSSSSYVASSEKNLSSESYLDSMEQTDINVKTVEISVVFSIESGFENLIQVRAEELAKNGMEMDSALLWARTELYGAFYIHEIELEQGKTLSESSVELTIGYLLVGMDERLRKTFVEDYVLNGTVNKELLCWISDGRTYESMVEVPNMIKADDAACEKFDVDESAWIFEKIWIGCM